LNEVAATLESVAQAIGADRVLEVGCGTGRWLQDFLAAGYTACGLDVSLKMLAQARSQGERIPLVCGTASRLPFRGASFDFVYCVHALHHFDDPQGFVVEARRVLRPGGALAIIGMDPHVEGQREQWYLYRYFPGTFEVDLQRFPSQKTLAGWMTGAGFGRTSQQIAERILDHKVGREVLESTFIQKHATSQLVLLSDEAYEAGIRRIEAAITEAESVGERAIFTTDIPLVMLVGWR
jgi:ubiquinone/menaquinone biosynthesis C-methylase UbiE